MFQRSSSLMRLVCDASQNLAEISLRVQTIELRRGNETVDNGGTLSSGIGTGSALILIMTEGEQGGNASLFINDKNVGEGRVEKTVVARFSADETFDLGMDTRTPVSADYLSPNAFNGKLKSAKIEVRASRLSVEEERQVRVLNQKAVLAAH
jgi:hypothetical protein